MPDQSIGEWGRASGYHWYARSADPAIGSGQVASGAVGPDQQDDSRISSAASRGCDLGGTGRLAFLAATIRRPAVALRNRRRYQDGEGGSPDGVNGISLEPLPDVSLTTVAGWREAGERAVTYSGPRRSYG